MKEEFAIQYAGIRAKERGYEKYRIVHRDFVIPANQSLRFNAYNEIWLITYIAWGLIVKSTYGKYTNFYVQDIQENTHEHGDQIEIVNTRRYQRTIRFLQVILKKEANGSKK